MRGNTADRAFVGLVALAVTPYVALCLFGCGLLSYLAVRVATDGASVLTADGDLRPAAAFFAVLAGGLALAVRSLWRQVRDTRRLTHHVRVNAAPLTPVVERASVRAGLAECVDVVDSEEPWSFTYGLLSPRVAVSTALLASAGPEELDAVLQHERYHVRSRDPLKLVIARALGAAFFFLPALGHLRRRYVAGRELAADRSALRRTGRRPLASALYRVVAGPAWPELSTSAAMGGDDLVDLRITQLETGREPSVGSVPRAALAVTGIAMALLLAGLIATVLAVGGPAQLRELAGDAPVGLGSMTGVGGVLCAAAWIGGAWTVRRGWVKRHR